MRVCLAAGILDWRTALDSIEPIVMDGWLAFDSLEPIGPPRDDLRSAVHSAWLHYSLTGEAKPPKDFLCLQDEDAAAKSQPDDDDPEREQSLFR